MELKPLEQRGINELLECLSFLDYPNISDLTKHSFQGPDFSHVANIVRFLALIYCPQAEIPESSSRASRIIFIQFITDLMRENCRIDLVPKALYLADIQCLPEIFKLIDPLIKSYERHRINPPQRSSLSGTDANQQIFEKTGNSLLSKGLCPVRSENVIDSVNDDGIELYDMLDGDNCLKLLNCIFSKDLSQEQLRKIFENKIPAIEEMTAECEKKLSLEAIDNNRLLQKIEKKCSEVAHLRQREAELNSRPRDPELLEVTEAYKQVYEDYCCLIERLTELTMTLRAIDKVQNENLPRKVTLDTKASDLLRKLKSQNLPEEEQHMNEFHDDHTEFECSALPKAGLIPVFQSSRSITPPGFVPPLDFDGQRPGSYRSKRQDRHHFMERLPSRAKAFKFSEKSGRDRKSSVNLATYRHVQNDSAHNSDF